MQGPVSQEEWERLRQETVNRIDTIVGQVGRTKALISYQQKTVALLESAACKVLFIEKSRRVGETWALAAYAVLRAGRSKAARGMDVMYISYSQEMTREFIDACAMWAKAFALSALDTQDYLFNDVNPANPADTRQIQAFRIRFASGYEISALSSAPRTLRGKQGVVIIDEAAFVDSLKELLKAALAFLIWGGQVIVCSTHNGAENEFNLKIQDILGGRSAYMHLRIDLDQALQDGLYQRICLVTGEEWSPKAEAVWRQGVIDFYGDAADEELFCVPSQGSGTWLTTPLIEARMTGTGQPLRLELPLDYLHRNAFERARLTAAFYAELEERVRALDLRKRFGFGFDFGRVADITSGTLLAIEQNLVRREALTIEMRGVPGDEQKRAVRMILRHVRPRLTGAAFDNVGMGWIVAEDMGREFGLFDEAHNPSGLVRAINLSEPWYREHMPPLKVAFEDGAIILDKDSDHVGDLRLVKLIRGTPRIPDLRTAEKDNKGKKRHGDFAVSLGLAHYATRLDWHDFGFSLAGTVSEAQQAASLFQNGTAGPGRADYSDYTRM